MIANAVDVRSSALFASLHFADSSKPPVCRRSIKSKCATKCCMRIEPAKVGGRTAPQCRASRLWSAAKLCNRVRRADAAHLSMPVMPSAFVAADTKGPSSCQALLLQCHAALSVCLVSWCTVHTLLSAHTNRGSQPGYQGCSMAAAPQRRARAKTRPSRRAPPRDGRNPQHGGPGPS